MRSAQTGLTRDPCSSCSNRGHVYVIDPEASAKWQRELYKTILCPRCGVRRVEQTVQAIYPLPDDWGLVDLNKLRPVTGEERALAHAKRVAGACQGWLSLQGSYGQGKTLMLVGLMNAVKAHAMTAVFLTGQTIADMVYRAIQPDSEYSMLGIERSLRHVHLLCIDELDKGGFDKHPFAFQVFFNILNWRYEQAAAGAGGMTAIACNDLEAIPAPILSRMNDGLWGDGQTLGGIIPLTAKDQRPRNRPLLPA